MKVGRRVCLQQEGKLTSSKIGRKNSGEIKGTRDEFFAGKFINIDRSVINVGKEFYRVNFSAKIKRKKRNR